MSEALKLKRYGRFNQWDGLKLLALSLMFIDHVGYFYLHDQLAWRALGRGALPVFLFLTGYAPSHRLRFDLILMAMLMLVVNILVGGGVLPLGILWGIIAGRVLVALLDKGKLQMRKPYEWMAVMALLFLPSAALFEPGTRGITFVLCGYMQQHAEKFSPRVRRNCMIFAFVFFGLIEQLALEMPFSITLLMAATLAAVAALLWHLRVQPVTPPSWLAWAEPGLRLLSRYTLWIYVLHFAVLQLITGVHY